MSYFIFVFCIFIQLERGSEGRCEALSCSVPSTVGLADEFVVLAMRADSEPMDAARYRQPERPVIKANSDAVILAASYSLEMQRWVRRISFELKVVPTREGLNVSG